MLLAATRTKVALAMGLLIALNLVTFFAAHPRISNLVAACCGSGQFFAGDFSVYFVGGKLFANAIG